VSMQTIAHYNLLEQIGRGGLGDTWRARDSRVGRTVAIKLIAADVAPDQERRDLLLQEARTAATLSHPNVATLFDTGDADGQIYLAYEYAPGSPLRGEMSGGALNPRRALELATQLADGVADAHAHGIVHGDLRPETIIITTKGSAKILDFGFARWTRGGMLRTRAATDPDALPMDAVKVLAYLSPEQALGGAVDSRTDVFSLGVITFELLTGRNPFTGATPADTLVSIIQGRIPAPSEINPAVPAVLDPILARALARDISERHQNVAEFAAELRSVLDTLQPRAFDPPKDSGLLPLDESPDKSTSATGLLIGAIAAAVVAAGVVWWWLAR
jgi:serine/threonine protein kinase